MSSTSFRPIIHIALFAVLILISVPAFVSAEPLDCSVHLSKAERVSLVQKLRSEMLDKNLGFTFVPVPQLLTDEQIQAAYDVLPEIYENSVFFGSSFADDPLALQVYADHQEIEAFRPYVEWVQRTLRAALPKETLHVRYAEVRKYEPGTEWRVDADITTYHLDGGWITMTIPFLGPGTEIVDRKKVVHQMGFGFAALLTAKERKKSLGIPATVHRAPTEHGEPRLLLVIRLGPI